MKRQKIWEIVYSKNRRLSIAQQARALATKPGSLCLTPETHCGRKLLTHESFLWPLQVRHDLWVQSPIDTHTFIITTIISSSPPPLPSSWSSSLNYRTREMAQQTKALHRIGNLSSIPWAHVKVEGENQLLKVVLWAPSDGLAWAWSHTHASGYHPCA